MATNYRAVARQAAQRYGLDPNVFERQIQQESGFQPGVRSRAGAIGIAQIMPGTAAGWHVDPTNPHAALDAAAKHMAGYVKQFGSYRDALVAYNAGPGAVGKPLPAETRGYIATILNGRTPSTGGVRSGGGATQTSSTHLVYQPGEAAPLLTTAPARKTVPVTAPAAPSFAAKPPLPGAYQALQTPETGQDASTPTQTRFNSGAALEALQALQRSQAVTPASSSVVTLATKAAGVPGRVLKGAKTGDPVARLTSVGGEHPTEGLAGFPARDYFAPAGSATVAPVSGKVVKLSGHPPSEGPIQGPHGPLGWSVYIQGSDGKTYYLTHMGSRNVKAGQRVKQGQVIGTVANYAKYGTPNHIHMGVSG
jgi:murein DD-endopeptidase MepM/ murein hydrolase activator NlpD